MGGWGKSRGSKGFGKSGSGRRFGVMSSIGKPRSAGLGYGGRRLAKGGGKGPRRQRDYDPGFLDRNSDFLDRDVPARREPKGFGKSRGGVWGNTVATLGRKGFGKSRSLGGSAMMRGMKGKGRRRLGGDDEEYANFGGRPRAGNAFGFARDRPLKGRGKSYRKGKGKGGMRGYESDYVLALPSRKGKGKGKYGKGKAGRRLGVQSTISKPRRTKGKGKGKKGRTLKGKGKGRKGKGKGRGKGKGKGKISKESLDRQLEEYMGPDAIRAVLDEELDTYFGTAKKAPEDAAKAPEAAAKA